MGGIGVHLDFEPGGKANLDELVDPIWDVVHGFIRRYAYAPRFVESYIGDVKEDERFVAGEKDIGFMFPDYAGLCSLSMYVTHHWTRLAFARHHEELTALATSHGQRLLGPRIDVADEIARAPSGGVIQYVDKLHWLATDGPNGATLMGNDGSPSPKLTRAKQSYLDAAVRLGWCGCSPCRSLRRELRKGQGWTAALATQWVCSQLGVRFEELAGNGRGKELAQARAAAAFLIAEGGPGSEYFPTLLGVNRTNGLLVRGMDVVRELGLVLPDDPKNWMLEMNEPGESGGAG
ncbi:MAG: hypothetical protein JNL83_26455 [Myxococcales bacterium]|nr:hypothetical protein [Myxococcales bacterium]